MEVLIFIAEYLIGESAFYTAANLAPSYYAARNGPCGLVRSICLGLVGRGWLDVEAGGEYRLEAHQVCHHLGYLASTAA
jgi:hypothetical protein